MIKNGHFEANSNIEIKKIQLSNSIVCLNWCRENVFCQYVTSNTSVCILYSFYAQYYKVNDSESVFYEKFNSRKYLIFV